MREEQWEEANALDRLNEEMQHVDLLPCPFCGGRARVEIGLHNFEDAQVSCSQCETSGPSFDNDVKSGGTSKDPQGDAVAHWNTRQTALMPVYSSKPVEE